MIVTFLSTVNLVGSERCTKYQNCTKDGTNGLTSLHVRHAWRRNAVGIHDRIIVDAPLRMSRQAMFIEQIAFLRLGGILFLLFSAFSSPSSEYQFSVLWMLSYVVLLFLVYFL